MSCCRRTSDSNGTDSEELDWNATMTTRQRDTFEGSVYESPDKSQRRGIANCNEVRHKIPDGQPNKRANSIVSVSPSIAPFLKCSYPRAVVSMRAQSTRAAAPQFQTLAALSSSECPMQFGRLLLRFSGSADRCWRVEHEVNRHSGDFRSLRRPDPLEFELRDPAHNS